MVILQGNDKESYIKILNAPDIFGVFFILFSMNLDISGGFDDWVSYIKDLQNHCAEFNWGIKWLN